MVYLVHFAEKLHHAQHYIGFCENGLVSRFETHRLGKGARILNALKEKGIEYSVVRIWKEGTREFERSLKRRKDSKHLCPICNPNGNQANLIK